MNSQRDQAAALGLVFAVGAVVGLLAGNKGIRDELSKKSKQLLSRELWI